MSNLILRNNKVYKNKNLQIKMNSKLTLLLMFLCLGSISLEAQDLLSKKTKFSRKDTLRGTLGPERTWFDVTYYDLNLTVEPDEKRIYGYNDIHFNVLQPEKVMQIDLFANMQVDSIFLGKKKLKYTREFDAVFIEIPKKLKKKQNYSIRFYYSGKPVVAVRAPWDGGFVWAKDKNGKDFVGTACQGMGASSWWPNKDHQTEEPDSMRISVAVPKGLKFVGNGNARGEYPEGDDKIRYDWFVSYPINNYDISLNIGDYAHFSDTHTYSDGDVLALDYYVMSYNFEKAKEHFEQVKPMLACYETYIGKYPFMRDGFSLVETPYLGMEHQSGIAYGNNYLPGYNGNTDYTSKLNFDYIIIHEAGHEWWGNSVTTEDIADMWIHEGFCTYTEAVYVECLHGFEMAMKYINDKKPYVGNEKPVIGSYGVQKEGSGDMYTKGMLLLNTVRHIIGDDDLWWEIFLGITQDFQHQIVTSAQIEQYIIDKSGKNLQPIFDQFLRYPALPVLHYKTKGKKNTKLTMYWETDVEKFEMPILVENSEGLLEEIMVSNKKPVTIKLKGVAPKNLTFGEDFLYFEKSEDWTR